MAKEKLTSSTKQELKPSPTLTLRNKVGARMVGMFEKRIPQKKYKDKFTSIFIVEFTDGITTLWDKTKTRTVKGVEKQGVTVEIDIDRGERVFFPESTDLIEPFAALTKGDKVEVIYKGEKDTGQANPLIQYDVFRIKDYSEVL